MRVSLCDRLHRAPSRIHRIYYFSLCSCCDTRRAVITVQSISLILNVIGLALVQTAADLAAGMSSIFDDGSLENEIKQRATISSVLYGFGTVVCFFTIIGAFKFNASFVGFGIFWTALQTAVSIVLSWLSYQESLLSYPIFDAAIRIGVGGLLVYPSAVFVWEARSGIMSAETYHREEYSCCCV